MIQKIINYRVTIMIIIIIIIVISSMCLQNQKITEAENEKAYNQFIVLNIPPNASLIYSAVHRRGGVSYVDAKYTSIEKREVISLFYKKELESNGWSFIEEENIKGSANGGFKVTRFKKPHYRLQILYPNINSSYDYSITIQSRDYE